MIQFKNEKARNTYEQVDSKLKDAVYECIVWCRCRMIPFVITRCIDDMIKGVSKTNIHADGRAIDVSIVGWTTDDIDDFVSDFNKRFSQIGAISLSDEKPRFCVYHNAGAGWHLHLQTKP
jgi:hypothetical protein